MTTAESTPAAPARQAGAAAAALLIVLILAGCGGHAAQPVSTLVSKVSAICQHYTAQTESLVAPSFSPATATAPQLGKAATYLGRAVPLLRAEQASIAAAGTPRADRPVYSSMRTALAAHVRDEAAALAAARARNLPAFHAAVAADQRDTTHLAGTAQQFGLAACV